ncbi:MAG: GTPase ObgE [Nitrospiraceae bacterium]|nr:GTPase ObgE [Nitrospiraceae bacterium]
MKFVDFVKIHIQSGNGGAGAVSFRREKYVPRGGPDGGDGGRGGHVIFRADPELSTLLDFKYQREYIAQKGQNGMKKKMHGKDGGDLIVRVPVGSVISDAETGGLMADMDAPGKEFVAAKGGRGGQGNQHFATAVRQAPKFAQPGMPGEDKLVNIELKLLADVGLIGLPNAGKSTLLSVITTAKPKIADYPFTTLEPMLGVVKLEGFKSFVVADVPGLIEGAHRGVGLGFQFLRHVERTRILAHLVDVSVGQPGDPVQDLEKINRELGLHSPALMEKPQAVVASKADAADPEKLEKLKSYCDENNIDFFSISAVRKKGLGPLLKYLARKAQGGEKEKNAL